MKRCLSLLSSGLIPVSSALIGRHSDDSLASCIGYEAHNVETFNTGLIADLSLAGPACNAYGDDLANLKLLVTYESDDRLHVTIQDKDEQVFQIPESVFPRPGGQSSGSTNRLKFEYHDSPFAFRVSRSDTDEVLFDTSAASLVFESQYLRLRTALPKDPYLYGLGEHSDPLRLNTTGYIRTLWNQDSYGLPTGANLYGAHPFYLEHRDSGSHGVFLLNSNGMDIIIDKAADGVQYLEYNTIGGVFDFWFFAGDTPSKVIQQYTEVVGRPAMQPYWGLGFHQCRYGYQDVYEVAEVVHNYSQADIPLETIWSDIDYMDGRKVFTLDPGRYPLPKVRELVSHLHDHNQHFVMMVDPAVAYQNYEAYQRGAEDDIFLKRSNGSNWLGVVWPGVTVFPDWFAENINKYWSGMFKTFFDRDKGVDVDALWIDMNEASNFCDFPCDDPFGAANGYPPPPPAVRPPPRELPGWPCDFQPSGRACNSSARSSLTTEPRNFNVLPSPETDTLVRRSSPQTWPEPGAPSRESTARAIPETRALARSTPVKDSRHLRSAKEETKKGLPDRNLLFPRYAIHNKATGPDAAGLSNHTINTDVLHQNGLAMYDTHNLYGAMMSLASRDAMLARRPGLRPLIITRSTFAGSGSKVGHWLGDNLSTWDHYRASMREILAFTSLYGYGFAGADVCGFSHDTTEELCARWASLGAFTTFFRNHNDLPAIPQEFYRWPSVARSARKAISIRYRLLDYIYTALYTASLDGVPALHPMFFKYPSDKRTWTLELQYFYGPGLLVAPVTEEASSSVSIYLPDDLFFDWYTHRPIRGGGRTHTLHNIDVTIIPLFIRAGVILPLRTSSAPTTAQLREQDFELIIPVDGPDGTASGSLYLDDGVSIDQRGKASLIIFDWKDGLLSIDGTFGYDGPAQLTKITILGSWPFPNETASGHSGSTTFAVDLALDKPAQFHV